MNCVLLSTEMMRANGTAQLDARQSRHVIDILNKQPGDNVLAGIIDGPIGMTSILSVENGVVTIEKPEGETPPRPPVHLILAMPRPKVMTRLWPAIASMGVGSVALIGANRVERCYFDSRAARAEHYAPLIQEGLEQARDTRMPDVYVEHAFRRFARDWLPAFPDTCSNRLIGHPGDHLTVREGLRDHKPGQDVVIAVGPEGGWTDREIGVFQDHGFTLTSFRGRALRTDTAIIALLSLVYDSIASPATEQSGLAELGPPGVAFEG